MAKTYTLEQVKKNIKDQAYFYVCLTDDRGKYIIPYNKVGDKKGSLDKFEEIKKRFEVLQDGVYYVQCTNSFRSKVTPDSYPILKGDAMMQEHKPLPVAPIFADNGKVMSYTEALKLTQENARLTAELSSAKKELSELQSEYHQLEEDYNEEETKPLAETNPTQNWLQTTVPTLMPVLDRFADLYEKKLNLDRDKLDRGIVETTRKTAPAAKPSNGRQLPTPGTPQFEQYLDQLEALEDEAFKKECEYLSKFHPSIYTHVYEAFKEEEEPTEEKRN